MSTTFRNSFCGLLGDAFSFFSPVIGWIGVFLTGSDTSANLLFGPLQRAAATGWAVPEALLLARQIPLVAWLVRLMSPQSISHAAFAAGCGTCR